MRINEVSINEVSINEVSINEVSINNININKVSINKVSNNKYVPPTTSSSSNSRRNNYTHSNNNSKKISVPSSTEKTALKKEFSLAEHLNAFPLLTTNHKTNNRTLLSFAQSLKTAKDTKDASDPLVMDVLPGWVNIKYDDKGAIQYKYGKTSNRYPVSDPAVDNEVLGNVLLNYRLAREQYERDNDVSRLGDLSEYYGARSLNELFAEEEILMQREIENENYSSDYSD